MANGSIIKRLEMLERAIVRQPPELVMVWTKSLADRIGKVLPSKYVLVHFPERPEEDAAFEALLREQNPTEAQRLDDLLQGNIASSL